MSNLKKLTQKRLFLPVFCMILVLCINMIYDLSIGHNFYNFFEITMTNGMLNGRIINILNRGSEVAILAIGMTLVVSASAGTDISVGSVMSLCASFCCMLVAGFGVSSVSSAEEFAMPLAVGLIGALLMGCLCGAFNGGLVAYLNVQPMVATLILWSAARAIGLLLCNNLIVYVRVPEFGVFGGYVGPVPTPIIIAAVCIAVASVVLKKTAMGMYIQSVGGSIIGAYTIQAITTTMLAMGVSTAVNPVFKAIIVIAIVAVQAPPVKAWFKKRNAAKALTHKEVAKV